MMWLGTHALGLSFLMLLHEHLWPFSCWDMSSAGLAPGGTATHPCVPAGLKHRREVAGKSAIFSGEHFVLEETDWYLLNLFRLWWHYGISFLRLQMWVEEVMEKFMR